MTTPTAQRPSGRPTPPSRALTRLGIAGGGFLIALIVLAGCGGGGEPVASETASVAVSATSTVSPTPPPTSPPPADPVGVSVVEDVLYREPTIADGVGSTVDIYVGEGNEGAPLVVLLHGYGSGGPGRPLDGLGPLGEEIAGLGATVFYFGWQTGGGLRADSFADLSCVGPFVAARAAEFGADPDNVIIVGHSMGGETGSMLAFSSFDLPPSPYCTEEGQASSPTAFLGIAGSYGMVGGPIDDDHTRFRTRTYPLGAFQDLDADEEILPGLSAAQIYQLDGYRALPPVADLDIVLLVGSKDQHTVTNGEITAAFAAALQVVNVDAEVVTIEGANHDNIVNPTNEYGQATLQVIADILANTR